MTEESRTTAITVLGIIALRGKPSGYEIRKWIMETVTRFWEIKEPEIRPILEQLVARGLVQTSSPPFRAQPAQVPPAACSTDVLVETPSIQIADWEAQIYSPTAAGRTELEQWLSQPTIAQPARNELLLKIIFAGRGRREDLVRHIEAFHQTQVDNLKLNSMAEQFLRISSFRKHPDQPYWILVNKYFKHLFTAMKDWSEAALDSVKGLQKAS